MQEASGMSLRPYVGLVMDNAVLDCEMKCLKSEIQCKNDENSKLEKIIAEYIDKIKSLEKSIKSSFHREEKVENNFHSLRNSRLITEGLIMSLKHEIKIHQDARLETKKTQSKVIEKYSQIFESYHNIYKNMPWIQMTKDLKISNEIGKIHLNILKQEYYSYKKKIALFNNISEKRVQVAIVNFSKLIAERNRLLAQIEDLARETIDAEKNIEQLKEDKVKLLEKKELKVKEAVAEARERAVKALASNYLETPKVAMKQTGFMTSVKDRILSLLGMEAPVFFKRPNPVKSLSQSVSQPSHSSPTTDSLLNAKENAQCIVTNDTTEGPPDKKLHTLEQEPVGKNIRTWSKKSREQSMGQLFVTKASEQTLKDLPLQKRQKCHASNSEEMDPQKVSPTISTVSTKHILEEKKVRNTPEETSQDTIHSRKATKRNDATKRVQSEKKKKKLKKKTKKLPGKSHTVEQKVEKKVTFADEEAKNNYHQQEKAKQVLSNSTSVSQPARKPDASQPNKIVVSTTESDKRKVNNGQSSKTSKAQTVGEESDQYPTDISIDSDSIISDSFFLDNRGEINDIVSRNIESPDFFIQRPQGFCFSPPLGQTISPIQGNKNDSFDFVNSSTISPLFTIDDKKKSTGGPSASSSFADFFCSSSPKKSDNSTKSFFQLFG